MEWTPQECEAEVLRLPAQQRAHLAEALLSSLDLDIEVEKAWFEEIDRRYQDYLDGRLIAIPADQVMAEARASLKR